VQICYSQTWLHVDKKQQKWAPAILSRLSLHRSLRLSGALSQDVRALLDEAYTEW
jgi:hypothetical protein